MHPYNVCNQWLWHLHYFSHTKWWRRQIHTSNIHTYCKEFNGMEFSWHKTSNLSKRRQKKDRIFICLFFFLMLRPFLRREKPFGTNSNGYSQILDPGWLNRASTESGRLLQFLGDYNFGFNLRIALIDLGGSSVWRQLVEDLKKHFIKTIIRAFFESL